MSTTTLTREVTGTFAVTQRGETWLDVEFISPDGRATAELSIDDCHCGENDDEDHYRPRWDHDDDCRPYSCTVWGVKVVDGPRGRGIGSALMANIVAHADNNQWSLYLRCEPHNSGEWIVGFYERFGFTAYNASDDTVVSMSRDAHG